MREDIAMKLTRKAAADNVAALQAQIAEVSDMFWSAHAEACEKRLGISRKKWPILIREGMLTATTSATPLIERDGKSGRYAFRFEVSNKHPVPGIILRDFTINRIQYSPTEKTIVLISSGSMPRFNGYEIIEQNGDINSRYGECGERLKTILSASIAMYDEAMSVLLACTTSRQLEDLLPEAAKLVPQPAAKSQSVMPSELAAKVRGMIETGIPV